MFKLSLTSTVHLSSKQTGLLDFCQPEDASATPFEMQPNATRLTASLWCTVRHTERVHGVSGLRSLCKPLHSKRFAFTHTRYSVLFLQVVCRSYSSPYYPLCVSQSQLTLGTGCPVRHPVPKVTEYRVCHIPWLLGQNTLCYATMLSAEHFLLKKWSHHRNMMSVAEAASPPCWNWDRAKNMILVSLSSSGQTLNVWLGD